jgi:hypothetical protein
MVKPSVLAVVMGLAVGVGCLVSTRSDKYACKVTADCQGLGLTVCENGYCVLPGTGTCPTTCNHGCNLITSPQTCLVIGNSGDDVTCPAGFRCTITCTPGTCGNINCSGAASCAITCSGDNACNNLTCGTADCTVTCSGTNACNDVTCGAGNQGHCSVMCSGTNACGAVNCSNSCDCVIQGCATSGECGNLFCPRVNGNNYCTGTGNQGAPCIDTTSGCSC